MSAAPEVILQFDEPFKTERGELYRTRVVGEETPLGQWEGWLEFTALDSSHSPIATERETTQPNRRDLEYWATGLSRVYIEGALGRAVDALFSAAPKTQADSDSATPAAKRPQTRTPRPSPSPVLNPFAVYEQGEQVLRQELGALSRDHLRNIIRAYDLGSDGAVDDLSTTDMAEHIVSSVRST